MTRRLQAGLAAALLGCWALATAAPDAPAPGPAGDDVQDVVLLADGRPVFLRLHIEVDGRPFRTTHAEALAGYLAALFKQLDANGDGVLSEDEAKRMPPPFKPASDAGGKAVHVAFNYRVVDADGDGKITREELSEYHREFSGGTVQVQPSVRTAVPPAVDQTLFNLLDTNKDGKLSKEELAAAADVLFPLDQDHDELLSPQEIAPAFYAAALQGGTAPVEPAPSMGRPAERAASLFLVSTDEDRSALAKNLLSRYGAAESAKGADRPADVELIVRLGKRAPGQGALAVFGPEGQNPAVRRAGDGGLALTFGAVHIELRANDGRPELPAGARQHYLDLFRGAAGKKGRLTQAEAQQQGFFPAQFTLLDRNSDGVLTEQEFTDYLDEVQDRQARLIGATPSLVLSGRARGLFEWLDRDRDGRLSLRELREASKLLERMGREAEGSVSRADFPEGYQMAVGAGQATLGRAEPGPFTPREAPMLTLDWSGPDLLWFTKMDRNRDGDVSPREFLGSAEDFKRLDADGDGLISRAEAEQAAELFRKK